MRKQLLILFLVLDVTFFPAMAMAEANIPGFYGNTGNLVQPSANQLPVYQTIGTGISNIQTIGSNQMVVYQDESKAIQDWDTFDIGADASVHFDQQGNTSWAALNRIYDDNPSQIFGRLSADGKIYLINPNGMLFGESAQVNVHTIAASALEMTGFDSNEMLFAAGDEQITDDWLSDTWVVNKGSITTESGGAVFLLAPNVANEGTIEAPDGMINMAAGTYAHYWETLGDGGITITPYFSVQMTGETVNTETGHIQADGGDIRLFGQVVNTDGLIRSVQAVNNQGTIELRATQKVHVGETGQIETPIDTSSETFHSSYTLIPGKVTLAIGNDPVWKNEVSDPEVFADRQILLEGDIIAPAGEVYLIFEDTNSDHDRIYLGESSSIDVSGLWVEKSAEDQLVETQLNSVELRDDYGQKDGDLQGETITYLQNDGTAIGTVGAHLDAIEATNAEKAAAGGTVTMDLRNESGDIVIREGAVIDISGGGLSYEEGVVSTSKLLCGDTVYDISDAPQYLEYQLLGSYTQVYDRFGQIESYEGIYYGGANSLGDYVPAYDAGANAGSLILVAPTIILDGMIDGSVYIGPYQTEPTEVKDESGDYQTIGRARPEGGKLTIGYVPESTNVDAYITTDPITAEIVISNEVQALPESFGPDTSLFSAYGTDAVNPLLTDYYDDGRPFYRTILSAETLNQAGLQTIELHSVTKLHIEADAELTLLPESTFFGTGRSILNEGRIEAPGGEVTLQSSSNYTVNEDNDGYIDLELLGPERIHLAAGSSIDVSGEQIDNSEAVYLDEEYYEGYLEGGIVTLQEYAVHGEGVVLEEGAIIDVSGGYQIDMDGTVEGGDGGKVTIDAEAIVLDGDLAGHSLVGYDGGEVELYSYWGIVSDGANTIQLPDGLSADDPMPTELLGKLIIGDTQLETSGFSTIELYCNVALTLENGVYLTPSNAKLTTPTVGDSDKSGQSGALVNYEAQDFLDATVDSDDIILVSDTELGENGIVLQVGVQIASGQLDEIKEPVEIDLGDTPTNEIIIPIDTIIAAAPTGTVEILAPNAVDVSGILQAEGGGIYLESKQIHLQSESALLANGFVYTEDGSLIDDIATDISVFDGGTVSLKAETLLQVDDGAVIDVSAADTVYRQMGTADGEVVAIPLDGHAGTVILDFVFSADEEQEQGLIFNGELLAQHADREGISGGTLELNNQRNDFAVSEEFLSQFLTDDFDALSLTSYLGAIIFEGGAFDLSLQDSILLDANEIKVGSTVPTDTRFNLTADLVTIQNSQNPNLIESASAGSAFLTISGNQGIEMNGHVALSGFQEVSLTSAGDIRVSDLQYTLQNETTAEGALETNGELVITANRIYPTTLSSFGFRAGGDSGKIAIHGNGVLSDDPIYSSDGRLIFAANEILHNGAVYAPMGDIVFCGDYQESGDGDLEFQAAETAIFSEQSISVTAGDALVYYGNELGEDNLAWSSTVQGGASGAVTDVEGAPVGSLTVAANTFVAASGATIDASGGGGIFSYRWDEGIEGSVNPLEADGLYVILPDSPGVESVQGVQLVGSGLVEEGEYALVSAEYAFAEGAMILQDMGELESFAQAGALSEEGYQLMVGYYSQVGTDRQDTTPHIFAVREAQDVLAEGFFQTRQITAGDGGTIQLAGQTNIVEARLDLASLDGFLPGTLIATGSEIVISNESSSVATQIINSGIVPDDAEGMLILNADGLLENSQGILTIGSVDETVTIMIESGVQLGATTVGLFAKEGITVSSEASLEAVAEGGTIQLTTDGGYVDIQESATLHAAEEIMLDTHSLDIFGDLLVDSGRLALAGDAIYVVMDDFDQSSLEGLILSQSQWDDLSGFTSIELIGREGLFLGDGVNLAVTGESMAGGDNTTLTIDTGLIGTVGDGADRTNSLSVGETGRIVLLNTGIAVADQDMGEAGELIVEAGEIIIGDGDIRIDGYDLIEFNARRDIAVRGGGSLESQGDVQLSAMRLTTTAKIETDEDDAYIYSAPDFTIAAAGRLSILSMAESSEDTVITELETATGGSLVLSGDSVYVSGSLDAPGATVLIAAAGDSGIYLTDDARLYIAGNAYAGGGDIELSSATGGITIADGAVLSVAAGEQGDAGSLSISAPQGTVKVEGLLLGMGDATVGGLGGAFSLDAMGIGELEELALKLASGGFTREIQVRSRSQTDSAVNLSLAEGSTLSAQHIKLVADGADLEIFGTITTGGAVEDGLIELYAGNDLVLGAGSRIEAVSDADDEGAQVYLGASEGEIRMDQATIDVSDSDGNNAGIVYFRAQREGNAPKMDLQGNIVGAVQVLAEAFEAVEAESLENGTGSISGVAYQDDLIDSAEIFMDGLAWDTGALDTGDVGITVVPGIEIRSSGDLTVSDQWDVSDLRFGVDDSPAALTLRAGGNLQLTDGIEDKPTYNQASLEVSSTIDTWILRLSAGADIDSADPMAVTVSGMSGTHDLTIDDEVLVYTQSAPIWFASGGDTNIGAGADVGGYISVDDMPANLMTYDKAIYGYVGGSMTIDGGAVQSALGDIQLEVRGNLDLLAAKTDTYSRHMGSIRTLGRAPLFTMEDLEYLDYYQYWNYYNGGDIRLDVGGDLTGMSTQGWGNRYLVWNDDYTESWYVWGPGYGGYGETHAGREQGSITQGIATLAGGDIDVAAGGSIYTKIGAFAQGDVTVFAGLDMDGRFLVSDGSGQLTAMQNLGLGALESGDEALSATLIELFDTRLSATAMGSVQIGSIVNPGVYSDEFKKEYWNMGYTQETAASLCAVNGDAVYTGQYDFLNVTQPSGISYKENFLPASISITAGRDILINADLYLAPSATGQLTLVAGRDIDGSFFVDEDETVRQSAQILMSEADPGEIYAIYATFEESKAAAGMVTDPDEHAETPLHTGDDQVVEISAGRDILNMNLILPKAADVYAGQDIYNFGFYAQTLTDTQTNTIYAAGDIVLQSGYSTGVLTSGIESAGPGGLTVQAGNDIDLGVTDGIQCTGSIRNIYLPEGDSPMLVVAGVSEALIMENIIAAFDDLKTTGEEYSNAVAEGDTEKKEEVLTAMENEIIPMLIQDSSGEGTLNMTKSQISTLGNPGDIHIIATGEVNVGKSALSSGNSKETGINAVSGGEVNIFVSGDLNVNESRIVSFGGGDILAWSYEGDINAGRGSKAQISTAPPVMVLEYDDPDDPDLVTGRHLEFQPPAVGSGIRALTFDPDGETGPMDAPEPGDIYLIAPEGTIDAGEAGIKGNNIFLAAQEVVNVQNIEISGASVGVPETSAVSGSLAALAGAGGLSETSKIAEESAAMKSAEDRFKSYVEEMSESLVPKWIAVEVVGFGKEEDKERERNR